MLRVNERTARVAMWLNQTFLLGDDEVAPNSDGNIEDIVFLCLRNRPHVSIIWLMQIEAKHMVIFRSSISKWRGMVRSR